MKTFSLRVLPALAVALLALPLFGQQPGGAGRRGGPMGPPTVVDLVTNKGVIEDLKMSTEQKDKLEKAAKEIRDKFSDDLKGAGKDREKSQKIRMEMNGEVVKVVDATLKPEQVKRLHQIEIWAALQTTGPAVFTSEKVAKALKLTDEQKSNLKEAAETLTKARQDMRQAGGGDPEKMAELRTKMQKTQTEAVEKFQGTLSEEQKKAWKELTGEKFEYKPTRARPTI